VQKYEWIEKCSVGVKEIDRQHQHFFEIVNEIIKMTGQKDVSAQDLLSKIIGLSDYAIYHFTTEENIFERYNYPDAGEHIGAHNIYREKMKRLVAEAGEERANTKKIALEAAEFAGSWLINHVMETDQKYVGFMHSKGIE
jgi:hemerythrin